MLSVKDVPPDQMAEVVRVAGELYDKETAENQERRATVAAAAEMGLPKEYLDRAAALVHARTLERAAEIKARRQRRRVGLVAGLGVALVVGGGWLVTHPRPAAPVTPVTYGFQNPAQHWNLNNSPGAQANAAFNNGAATIHVSSFGAPAGGDQFFVNLDTEDVPQTLAGYRTVSFRASGAGLPNLRLYLENADERWRSPLLTPAGQVVQVNLNRFDHQTRDSPTGKWHTAGADAPGHVERLSFKVGYYVNAPDAHGDVKISELRFQ